MSIDRIGTAANAQILLGQIQRAENALNTSNQQVATGQRSDTYTGYGTQTAALEAARSAAARADANVTVAQQAASRLDLQDTQLSQLGQIADQVRQALTSASANNDASGLMGQMQDLFDQAVTILNAKDGSSYIYAGDNDQTAPVTVTSLTSLAALPNVSDAFTNGSNVSNVRIGDGRTVQVGLRASDLATQLFSVFRDVAQFNLSGNGPFNSQMNSAQSNFVQNSIQQAIGASSAVNAQAAANGDRYTLVNNAIDALQASSTVYKGFVSNIQDVDMGQAMATLTQNQMALQAVFQVSSHLNQLSLLNYLQ